jgi:hypothetical protein
MTGAQEPPATPQRAGLAALYLRVANTLEQSADLTEQHAQRHRDKGKQQAAAIELERAQRARVAAQRGRAHALRLQASDAYRPEETGAKG